MIYGVVYLILNLVNGKKYVGQTTHTVEERFKQHAAADSAIGNAIRKYGVENFYYGVIMTCYSKEELNAQEIHYIAVLRSKAPTGYNLTDGGDGGDGGKPYDEARANMSAERVERYKNPAAHEVLSIAQKKRHATVRIVRGLIIALLVARRTAETAPETTTAFLGAVLERSTIVADHLLK